MFCQRMTSWGGDGISGSPKFQWVGCCDVGMLRRAGNYIVIEKGVMRRFVLLITRLYLSLTKLCLSGGVM